MTALIIDRNETLAREVEVARQASLAWLGRMQAAGEPKGVSRISAAHDAAAWPGVLVYGTYNAILCRALIGGLDGLGAADRAALIAWFERLRLADGRFRIPGMTEDAVWKKPDPDATWQYIDFHVTNYTLGAIEVLNPAHPQNLDFVRPYLDPLQLKAWLAERDLRDPWQEGNNIVNLAGFLLGLARHDRSTGAAVDRAVQVLFDWHDRLQEPSTGFWGVGQASDPQRLLHAFAGSMHNYHLWYLRGRPLAAQDRAVDFVLSRPTSVHSACIDVDEIDLLIHAHAMIEHRRNEIAPWCRAKLESLLAFRNADGGFADERSGVRRQDGWVRGYQEPQGLSNTFATWFRWIAIAMAADLLWPGRWPWRFRSTIGIGYRMAP